MFLINNEQGQRQLPKSGGGGGGGGGANSTIARCRRQHIEVCSAFIFQFSGWALVAHWILVPKVTQLVLM